MVRLVKDGEVYKLSKRSGKAVTLETLLEEIPVDAARFFFNLREANSHFEFDLALAVEQSSKNPVYYVQYAHARICSILRKLEEEGIRANSQFGIFGSGFFAEPEEFALIRHLASFPGIVDGAARTYDPSPVTRYSIETASLFHKFYDKCRVKCVNPNLMQARIALCIAVKTTLKNIFDMLRIDAPERM
jgi:arginyl-tRNA synthetase